MDDTLFEQLLHEGEGPTLDVKQSQYAWTGTDNEKSEILKDVLAFANAWRRTTAYILIGVREGQGRHEVVGTDDHPFDDAHLQQFINAKTNRAVTLSYEIFAYEEKRIGIITIPMQQRPFYCNADYGKVRRELVYYRMGSSTAVASPDEIAKMGAADHGEQHSAVPVLTFDLVEPDTRKILGVSASINCIAYGKPARLPDYEENRGFGIGSFGNEDFWRDTAEYLRVGSLTSAIGVRLINESGTLAKNVRIEIAGSVSNEIFIADEDGMPGKPSTDRFSKLVGRAREIVPKANRTSYSVHDDKWLLTIWLADIQPKAMAWSEQNFFVGAVRSQSLQVEAVIYADNLPSPQHHSINIDFKVESRPGMTFKEIKEFIDIRRSEME